MHNESNTIFDQNFLKETFVRRRQLMPLALKIYVWFYMLFSVYGFFSLIYTNATRLLNQAGYEFATGLTLLPIFIAIMIPLLRFLSNLLIWLEKKSAILTGIIITVLHILYSGLSFAMVYKILRRFEPMMWNVILMVLLEIPYLVLLLNIRKRWEQTGISGNEQEQHFKGLK